MPDRIELNALTTRLKVVVDDLVEQHRKADAPLTWRLLHRIAAESVHVLKQDGELDPLHLHMMHSTINYPKTDDPVNFGNATTVPFTFSIIQKAYYA
jgi:hypothetical protein